MVPTWTRSSRTPTSPGSRAVAERGLERLIQKVEAGESEGVVTPWLDRFGRDLIEGSLALKRIVDAGGRLIAVRDGFDSASPGSELTFNLRMSIAQDFLSRTRANFQASVDHAAEKGIYLAAKPPFGYGRDEERRLVADRDERLLVRELFKRRAEGANYAELKRWLSPKLTDLPARPDPETGDDRRRRTITKQGVKTILSNRAYVGEMRAQSGQKGSPRTITNSHPPLVSHEEWEAAQIHQPFVPRNGTAAGAALRGLVFCGTCGRRCKTGLSGPPEKRRASYVCTADDCAARASMRTDLLDDHVEGWLMLAAAEHEPHMEAIILGDTRFADAMAEVEEARSALEEFRDSIEMQRQLGMDGFAKGLAVRKEALEVARRRLSEVRAPEHRTPPKTAVATRESIVAVAPRREHAEVRRARRPKASRDRAAREPAAPSGARGRVLRRSPGAVLPLPRRPGPRPRVVTGPPPVTGISELVLEVSDLDAARRFYRDDLGFEETLYGEGRDGRYWYLVGDSARLGLWTPQVGLAGGRGGAHVHFAFHVAEVELDRLLGRLRDRGVEVEGPVQLGPGRAVYVTDPDRNVVEFWTQDLAEYAASARAQRGANK